MVSDDAPRPEPDPGYPAHWEADVVLRDGRTMRVRPILPGDADALQAMHRGQSESSVVFRFFAPRSDLTVDELRRFTHVDHRERVALVLLADGVLGAVGRFDATGGGEAEVAFYVSDALHGLGLGSVLLEHLAAAAGEVGVDTFTADVLPHNGKMLGVFRDAGFPVRAHTEDGVLSIRMSVAENARSWAVRAERERRAESLSIARVLGASAVLLGACGRLRPADEVALARVRASLAAGGFTGDVLDGDPARLAARAQDVAVDDGEGGGGAADGDAGRADLALLAGPPADVVAAIAHLPRLGVRGVVVLGGGFAEEPGPDGRDLQRRLLAATRAAGLRLIGPHSLGVLAAGPHGVLDALAEPARPSTEALALVPPRLVDPSATPVPEGAPARSGLGLFGQSAESSHLLVARARARGIPVASVLSAGNRADVSGNDAMQWWSIHEPTSVGVTYLESIGNPRKYSRIARRLSRDLPLVALVAGTTARSAPPGHRVRTSPRPARVLTELLRQAGVLRPGSMTELLDLVSVLAAAPGLGGARVATVASSPGYAGALAELLRAAGFEPGPVAVTDLARGPADLGDALAGCEEADAVVVALSEAHGDVTDEHAAIVAGAAAGDARPWIAVDGTRTGWAAAYAHEGRIVPAVGTTRAAVRVLTHLRERREWLARADEALVEPAGIDRRAAQGLVAEHVSATERPLPAEAAAALLRQYGIAVLPTATAATPQEAVEAAAALRDGGAPAVVLRLADPVLSGRSSLGGLRLGLRTDDAVREAWAQLTATARELGRDVPVEVQAQAPAGVACSVRAGEDPLYGPVVSFGMAGDATDLLDDLSYRIAPLTEGDLTDMLDSVRAAPRLRGTGGHPAADSGALRDLLARVSELVDDQPHVSRLVLEPVIAGPGGAVVAGARVSLARAERTDSARRILPTGE